VNERVRRQNLIVIGLGRLHHNRDHVGPQDTPYFLCQIVLAVVGLERKVEFALFEEFFLAQGAARARQALVEEEVADGERHPAVRVQEEVRTGSDHGDGHVLLQLQGEVHAGRSVAVAHRPHGLVLALVEDQLVLVGEELEIGGVIVGEGVATAV